MRTLRVFNAIFSCLFYPSAGCIPLVISLLCAPPLSAATKSPFTVLHSFTGVGTDGARPTYGASLVASGSTLFGSTQNGGARTNGVLFKLNNNGSGFAILHTFDGSWILNPGGSKNDGAFPAGTPVLDGSTLYGMTTMGGSNGIGTIYRINTDGSGFQILHHFSNNNTDGGMPSGSLVLSGSTLFGMTESGGLSGGGVIFRIETSGEGFHVLHSFAANLTDGTDGIGSLTLSGSALFGMTRFGGNSGQGVLFTLGTNGSGYHILHSFAALTTDAASPSGSLTLDGSTLYGMGSGGGANNVGAVFKIATDGSGFQLLHSFATTEGWQPYGDVTLVAGKLYGMTSIGSGANGLGSGVLFQLGTDGNGYQVLHNFMVSFTTPNGASPFGSLVAANSVLYGMTSQGGSKFQGCIFSYNLGAGGTVPGTPELHGEFSAIKQTCTTRRGVLGCVFGAALTVQNTGTASSPVTHLRYVFSSDGAFDPSTDLQFGKATLGKIPAGKLKKLRLRARTTQSVSGQYLLAVDDNNTILASMLLAP